MQPGNIKLQKKLADDNHFPSCLSVYLTLTLTFQILITSNASFFTKNPQQTKNQTKKKFLRTDYGQL